MVPHPKSQTKQERTDTWRMIDAFRKVETDLHHRLLELRTIPSDWDGIFERRRERHPKRVKVTAAFDADVVRFFKGLGPGYQWRMNEVLRAYVHGRMAKIVQGPDTTDYILHPERIPEEPEVWEWGQAEASLDTPPPPEDPREARAEAEIRARAEAQRTTMAERARVKFEAWKVKAAEADAKGEPRPPLF
jgi:uncharacterized protein (DUF4415 family)